MVYVQITQVTPSRALQTTSGWADSYAVAWNAVMGRALATRVDSLSVGLLPEMFSTASTRVCSPG